MTVLKWLLGAGVLVYVGMALTLFLTQARLVFRPYHVLEATPADVGLVYENLRLTSGQETINAWYVPAAGKSRGTVLFCHGNAGNISHRLETIALLHALGLNTLLFDYRGYGESTGKPSERGTYADAATCWDWLVRVHGEKPGRIVVMGRSLGGGVAAQLVAHLAETNQEVAGLILESTFTSVPDMGARIYPFLPVRLLSRIHYDTRSRLARITCPVLVAHSPEDDVVPYALGRELLEQAKGRAAAGAAQRTDFLELTGNHNSGYLLSGETYLRGLDQFFAEVLSSY